MEEYPRDWIPLDSLAGDYSWYLGQHEKGAQLYERAWALDPQQPFSPAGLAAADLALNRVTDARAVLDRALAMKLDNLPIRTVLYELAVLQGDAATAEMQIRWSASQPVQDNLGPTIASAAAQRGRLRDARATVERDARELKAQGFNESAASEYSAMAVLEASFHNFPEARRLVASSLALFHGRSNLQMAALALSWAGDAVQAQAMIEELTRRYSHDALQSRLIIPCSRAALEIHRHRYERAIALLDPVRRFDFGTATEFYAPYFRGLAYLGNRQAEAAANEFEQVVKNRGVNPVSPNWTLAHLGLARAYELSGDRAKARAAYETFFALWKDADADIPILQEAKAEYRSLK
jgi:tetratricopeptide (TPR) repeat protein